MKRLGVCNCAQHCPESPYHERACCTRVWCDCWCHEPGGGGRQRTEHEQKLKLERETTTNYGRSLNLRSSSLRQQ